MKIARRAFLVGVSLLAMRVSEGWAWSHGNGGIAIPPNVWMEAPDILAFYVDDAPIIPGNILAGSFSGNAYDTWFQLANTGPGRSGNLEWCAPFGPLRDRVKFSDLPNPAGYLSHADMNTLANYSIGGGVSITALYYRSTSIGQGDSHSTSSVNTTSLMLTQRHTVYLKLSSTLTNGATYTITNSASPFAPIPFTFNDKRMRAGGIQINQIGQRPDDAYKYVYLASRIPIGPNNGTVDFAGTYGLSSFQILNGNKASVFSGSLTSRVSASDPEKIASFTGFVDDGTGGGSPSGVAGTKLTVTSVAYGFITAGNAKIVNSNAALNTGAVGVGTFVSGVSGGAGVYNITPASPILVPSGTIWIPDGFATGIDVADLSNYYSVTGMTAVGSTSITVDCVGHPFANGDKCRFVGISGMVHASLAALDQGPVPVGSLGYWVGATVTVINANQFSVNLNGSSRTAWSATPLYSTGSQNNKVVKCFNTNRAGTYVWGMDLSSWTPTAGIYYIYIPSYGISDPISIQSSNWAVAAAAVHEGIYNLRLGCAVNLSPGYTRGIALADGVNGCTNYLSTIVAPFSSECAAAISIGATTASGNGAYAAGAGHGPGFITSVRQGQGTGTQDAGDNDDLAVDHIFAWTSLAWVLFDLPKPSRVTPFNVPATTSLLDSTLYAGADALPPLIQEVFWYLEGYRRLQNVDGSVHGGTGVGHFNGQIPNYPETIDYYRGTDAGGALAGQMVMAFVYASDHWGTMQFAAAAAKVAALAYDYSLTALGDAWKAAAIAAYNWADNILTNQTARDTYYNTTLNLISNMGWTVDQYQRSMVVLNNRCVVQKADAAGFLFRLLGSGPGAAYGNFYTQKYCGATPTIVAGSSGYVVGDTISLGNGIVVLVTAVSSGVITAIQLMNQGQFSVTPSNPVAQVSTSGSGINASFNLVAAASAYYTLIPGTMGPFDYCATSGADATAKTYLQTHYQQNTTKTEIYLSPHTSYQGMQNNGTTTSGGTNLNSPLQMIQAHKNYIAAGGSSPSTSTYLQAMQAGLTFIQGGNLLNRAFIIGAGTRSQVIGLHEDSYKMGVPTARGMNVFGQFAWATSSMSNNFAVGANSDGPLNFNAEYYTGSFQSQPTPGSAKLWDPLRWGSGYWEWSPQNKNVVFNCEYTQKDMLATIYSQLYCHGWDGNV